MTVLDAVSVHHNEVFGPQGGGEGNGGGVSGRECRIEISGGLVSENVAPSYGGGIHVFKEPLILDLCAATPMVLIMHRGARVSANQAGVDGSGLVARSIGDARKVVFRIGNASDPTPVQFDNNSATLGVDASTISAIMFKRTDNSNLAGDQIRRDFMRTARGRSFIERMILEHELNLLLEGIDDTRVNIVDSILCEQHPGPGMRLSASPADIERSHFVSNYIGVWVVNSSPTIGYGGFERNDLADVRVSADGPRIEHNHFGPPAITQVVSEGVSIPLIRYNVFEGGNESFSGVSALDSAAPRVHHNNLLRHTFFGVVSTSSSTVPAEQNWWGVSAGANAGGDNASAGVTWGCIPLDRPL